MRRAVLADTGPLYAAAVAADDLHERARTDLARLVSEGTAVIAPYPTLLETYTLVLRRTRPRAAQTWLETTAERLDTLNPTESDYLAAFERVQVYSDQSITLFDALLAILSERLELPVWSYDHHFDVMRASVWR